MSQVSTAAGILKSVVEGPAWHADAVLPILSRVSAAQAAARPIENAHTIWEILLHMIAWQEFAIEALTGGDTELLPEDVDWPPVAESGEEAWRAAIDRFKNSADRFHERVAGLDDAQMTEPVPGREFKVKVMVHGVSLHNCYHSGQIGLLLKALS